MTASSAEMTKGYVFC